MKTSRKHCLFEHTPIDESESYGDGTVVTYV